MNAASAGWDMACRMLGECRHGRNIDNEIGDMVLPTEGTGNFSGAKLFTYMRYDPDVSQAGLDKLGLAGIRSEDVQTLDSVAHIPAIQRVGAAYAARDVKMAHFAGFV
jgi:hypothetical protein